MELNSQKILERLADFILKTKDKIAQIKWSRLARLVPPLLLFLKGRGLGELRWPKLYQWKRIGGFLSKKERVILLIFFTLFLGSSAFLTINFYLNHTHFVPAHKGKYTEGVIGSPRFINPIYADLNDVDRDLVAILFSGLMKYDKDGRILPDLAEKIEVKEEGKKIEAHLKPNLLWSDGQKMTADDIIFTIKTIQDADYKSPLRTNWLGIEIEKVSDTAVSFRLKKPYSAFLERLTTPIIPKHIWQDISPQNFPLSVYNFYPVGSGPYRLKTIGQDNQGHIKSLILETNPNYFGEKPYLSEISFLFFEEEKDLVSAFRAGKVNGFSLAPLENLAQLDLFNLYSFKLPRYFAVFFNLLPPSDGSKLLTEKRIREALSYGTDKKEIVEKALGGKGEIIHSPILPEIYQFQPPKTLYEFDLEKAKKILDEAGFEETEEGPRQRTIKKESSFQFKALLKSGSTGKEVEELQRCLAKDQAIYPEAKITGSFGPQTEAAVIKFQEKYYQDILKPWGFKSPTGIVGPTTRNKLNEICFAQEVKNVPLTFSLITVEDPLLLKVAELLKNQWGRLGVEIEIKRYPASQIEKEVISPRNFEMLLFGESLGITPDLLPFWHSSQKKDPGLNLPGYENKEVDKLLEEARTSLDPVVRTQKYQKVQEILIGDVPCLFLFSPDYLYWVSSKIKGVGEGIIVDPSKRFLDIENWYIKTKRAWK